MPVDAVLLLPPLEVILRRVRERVGHPGGVQGESGAQRARGFFNKLVPPAHVEGFELITKVETPAQVDEVGITKYK